MNPLPGVPHDDVPLFLLFTHDDAITQKTFNLMTAVTQDRAPRGCKMSATMFTLAKSRQQCVGRLWGCGRGGGAAARRRAAAGGGGGAAQRCRGAGTSTHGQPLTSQSKTMLTSPCRVRPGA